MKLGLAKICQRKMVLKKSPDPCAADSARMGVCIQVGRAFENKRACDVRYNASP